MKNKTHIIIRIIIFITLLVIDPLYSNAQWAQVGIDIDGEAVGDQSGHSVSMNAIGDRMAIGALDNDGNGSQSGHVRIYEWDSILTIWTQLGADLDGEAAFNLSGNSVSMDSLGNRIAIAARYNDGAGIDAGHVRLYEWNGVAWIQMGADIDGEAAGDQSGLMVSINASGNIIVIGAHFNDGTGNNAGHVRVFEWNTTAWVQKGTDIDGEAVNDQSGFSVSLNGVGDRLAIGAPFNDGNGSTQKGHVRIYVWNGIAWTQLGTDIDGEAAYDRSGHSVSMNRAGDRLAIGAPYNNGNGTDAGHVRIYEWTGIAWTQLGADIDGEAIHDWSGYSVSMNEAGDQLAIGAYRNGGNGNFSGHVRIYEWNATAWIQRGNDVDGEAISDQSGFSVSMNAVGNRLAIGAPRNDGTGNDAGHVRVFQNNLPTGIGKPERNSLFSIYPNPASESVILETQNTIGEVAQIASVTGALLLEFCITKEKESIDLSGFQNGIYFLRVGEQIQKIIISK